MKSELGDRAFVDTFKVERIKGSRKNRLIVEFDGVFFDSDEYPSKVKFLQDIVDRSRAVALGEVE
jgi:hypothetical protein